MPGIRLAALVRRMRRDAALDLSARPDADLLARFAALREEAAFELLVWRHGAMVLSACRRVLGNPEDAEDAFQATFLVLARKAASVRSGAALSAWLHRVAIQIAQRLVRKRRSSEPLSVEPTSEPAADAAEQRELGGILDREIDRLSDSCRRAFVLCYLEGLSNAEAARALGCPVGTIESRLSSARRILRERLSHRVGLPAGLLALLASNSDLGANAVSTLTRACQLAVERGLKAAIGIVGEPAVRLAQEALAMTKLMKASLAAILCASTFGLAAGVGWAQQMLQPQIGNEEVASSQAGSQTPPATEPPAPPVGSPAVAVQPTVEPAPPTGLTQTEAWPLARKINGFGNYFLLGVGADGKSLIFKSAASQRASSIKRFSLLEKFIGDEIIIPHSVSSFAFSSDGKYLATAEEENGIKLREAATGKIVEAIWPPGELPSRQLAFTPDGGKLISLCGRDDDPLFEGEQRRPRNADAKLTRSRSTRISVWDLATRKEVGLPAWTDEGLRSELPQYRLAGFGQFVIKTTSEFEGEPGFQERKLKSRRFTIIDATTGAVGKPIRATGPDVPIAPDPLSPDGKTLALYDSADNKLQLVNVETGANGPIVQTFRRKVQAFAFSQDGRFVAAAVGSSPNESRNIAAPSEIVIWDAKTGRELLRVADKEIVQNYVKLAFSADASFLVVQAESPYPGLTIWGHPPIAEPKAAETVEMPGKAEAKKVTELPSPARFQSLFRDLAAESTSDARRVEAVFLATLGRFPTDVEARTLVSQLAKRSDKAAALKDLLDTLVETAEFKVHAEELGRLAK